MSGMSVEEKRAAHYAYFCQIMPDLVARLTWSRAAIDDYKLKAFREALRHAQTHSAWYAKRTAHLDPSKVTLADLVRIPAMTKSDLMANWDDIVTAPGANRAEAEAALRTMRDQFYIWENCVLFTSGGTGGQPGVFLYDWDGLAQNWGGMARGVSAYVQSLPIRGVDHPHAIKIVAIGAEMSGHGSFVVGRIFANPNNAAYQLSGWRSAEDLLPKLNAIQPDLMTCYPSLIPALAEAARAGALAISPQAIACGGEHFPETSRRLAQETWPQTEILNCWGTSEGGGTFPCPCGDGFHIGEDQVIIEPVDSAGNPVAPGERSAGIYFTNLYNKAMPIFRYYIDDVFEMDDTPCPCGSVFQKVKQVHGRGFEMFQYGSVVVHPVTLQLAVLDQPKILEYQITQTPNGVHLAYRSPDAIDDERLRSKLRDALRSFGIDEPDIQVERVDQLQRTKAGKLKRFVPLTS